MWISCILKTEKKIILIYNNTSLNSKNLYIKNIKNIYIYMIYDIVLYISLYYMFHSFFLFIHFHI